MGFASHLLEIVPDRTRSLYVGTGNTIPGLLALVPMLYGWLLETISYAPSSSAALVLATAGILLSLTVSPRRAIAPIGAYQ